MQPVTFYPGSRGDNLYTAFVQDEIALVPNLLRLTLGSKFEHNDYSGFEFQPNIRLLWTPLERHTVWAAISRAVRTPSRADGGIFFYGDTYPPASAGNPENIPLRTAVISSPDFGSEELVAYELGYRVQPLRNLSFDIAAFINSYDRLRDVEPLIPTYVASPSPHYLLPFLAQNNMRGETWGVEVAADWKPFDWWRLLAAYTFLDIHMGFSGMTADLYNQSAVEGRSPGQQFSLRSRMELGRKVQLDTWLRYVGRLPDLKIGSYLTLDVRAAWEPLPGLEISLVGQNLFHTRHPEFKPEFITTVPTDVERGIYGAVTWRY
jgi:iron complex outermembrane receptor protein